MKKSILSVLAVLFIGLSLQAQTPYFKNYNWEKGPNYSDLEIDSTASIMAFKEKHVNEFFFEEDGLVEYFLEHRLIWLNSDDKIEEYNKVYLPYGYGSELLVNKARVVKKDGTVLVLDQSKIHTAEDEETRKTYKYYAFEGIEKGSFIEYYYVVKRYPKYKGVRKTVQADFPKRNVELDFYAPSNLVFAFKSYNGLAVVIRDTISKDKLHWTLREALIPKLEYEEMSPYAALQKYIVYKLDRNTANNTYDISSYSTISKNMYGFLYKELTKKESSSIKNLISNAGLKKVKTDEEKLRKLENFVKNKFYISEVSSDALEDISTVIKKQAASVTGLMKIYIAAAQMAGIKVEVVLTSDRFKTRFDPKFEADNFLTDYLLYFPSVKKLMAVDKMDSRLGFVPPKLTDTYGLFIKEVAVGGYKNGIGRIKYIAPNTGIQNANDMDIEVQFDKEDLTHTEIKFVHSYGGYTAKYIQPYLSLGAKEKIDEMYDMMIKSINSNLEIKSKKATNNASELFGVKPLILTSETTSSNFVSKAGRKYLFKVGELIGPQTEMYQEKKRVLDLETDYKRSYKRVIKVEIPKGYLISNLETLTIDNKYQEQGKDLFGFHSYYKLNGNMLQVFIDEYYNSNKISANIYEEYRKVINSAADFNKLVLVFEQNK